MNDFSTDMQKFFLELILQDARAFVKVQSIFNEQNFDKQLRDAAKFIRTHAEEYKTLPERGQIKAVCSVELQPITELNNGHIEWFYDAFEQFTRRKELERAILTSADMIAKGEFDPIEKIIKDAVQISLIKDLGTDYFADPRGRLLSLKQNNGQVSTGYRDIDKTLYGGFNRGELNIFAGGSGSGKSLFMQNLSANWILAGLHGVYITLELKEALCSMRLDSMLSNIPSFELFKELDTVEMKIKMLGKKSGSLKVKYMPAQSNLNHIRGYLKELEIQTNRIIDFICVDYLDLLMPISAKVSPNDLFVKDKYVSEELRILAADTNTIFVTASQLNRSAVEEVEFDHSHIAGGISKINTADNVFGIFTSRAMRERGRYQLQLMKTRNSNGVGKKIELEYDNDTLRISDLSESATQEKLGNIYDQIRGKTKIDEDGVITTDAVSSPKIDEITVQKSKLSEMIKRHSTLTQK